MHTHIFTETSSRNLLGFLSVPLVLAFLPHRVDRLPHTAQVAQMTPVVQAHPGSRLFPGNLGVHLHPTVKVFVFQPELPRAQDLAQSGLKEN